MPNQLNVLKLLDEFTQKRILIVGDVMVDEYLWGNVNRISPEAPVPVVSFTEREYRMGGAANVAINVKSLGAIPIVCSVIGKDPESAIFKQLFKNLDLTDEGIIESPHRKTTLKTRIIGNHQHLLRVDHEDTLFLDQELENQILKKISEIINSLVIDAVIFQDYDKGILTPALIDGVIKQATEKKIPTLVDPKRRSFLGYHGVTFFKPNFKELTEGLNVFLKKTDTDGLFDAVQVLHIKNSIRNVMVTLSEKGVFISNGKTYKVFPAEERDIADVSGAGDTVICVAALATACGVDAFQAAFLANKAGGLVCEKIGVVPITPTMLLS